MSGAARAGSRVLCTLLLACAGCGAATPTPSAIEKQHATRESAEQPDKLLERGRAFARIGDNNRAEQYLSGALDGGADPQKVLPLLMRVCIAERRFRVAIDYAEPHLRRRPTDFKLRFVVASLYASIGETASARRELELVMQTKPDHADAHYALAVIYRDEDKDPVKADVHFREYLRLRPDGPHAEESRASLLRDAVAAPPLQMKTVPPPPTSLPMKTVPPPRPDGGSGAPPVPKP